MSKGAPNDSKKAAAAPAAHPAPNQGGGGASHAPSASRGNAGGKIGCHADFCHEKDARNNFCAEHFRQFKFGLIAKTGKRVLDYERKLEHYQNWLRSQKVA